MKVKELTQAIEIAEAAIDREVYTLFGLDEGDVTQMLAFQPRTDEPVVDAAGSEPPGGEDD